MSLSRLLLALLLILAPAAHAQPAPEQPANVQPGWLYQGSDLIPDPAWRFGTLPNGVRWAVRRNARPEGQVSIRIRIDAGSLHETPEQQGWAHLVEHLAFRGTASFGDREARHIWQQLGASFGSDSNAFTSITQTVYQLDLPHAGREPLDRSLAVLAEMMASARFEPAAVDAERQIVLREKERRPELTTLLSDANRRLFYHGLTLSTHETIGTEATLGAATPEALRAFYQLWYRPERATVIMVGDADPAMMEELIARHFGAWQGVGPAPADPDYGALVDPLARVDTITYAGAPTNATLAWVRPYAAQRATREQERIDLERTLATAILNRRLERHARGESAFISAGVGVARNRAAAELTQLGVSARDGRWQEALSQTFAIIGDGLRAPPSGQEIARELANMRSALAAAVQGEASVQSQTRATQLVAAVDSGDVVMPAPARLALFDDLAPAMTPERIGTAMRDLFTGSGPRMLLLSPEPIEGGVEALSRGLQLAEQVAPAARGDDRQVSFESLPPLGGPGEEVARERLEDLDTTIVRFANGSTLTFKPTRFEEGRVLVQLRFGNGMAGLPADRPSLGWASGIVAPSGLADLDLDAMERLLTGRRIGLSFGIGEDSYAVSGATRPEELSDQFRLLATKLAFPRWDPVLFRRFQTNALQNYDLQFATASARGQRELAGLTRPGDQRWQPYTREALAAATLEDIQAFFAPRLAEGPVHAVVVGDAELEAVVAAARNTIGALPRRTTPDLPTDPAASRPPAPNPESLRFTHNGDPAQAFALIGWSTTGGLERRRQRRALSLAANLFQSRLFDRLREEEGASYSPNAAHFSSDVFPNYGIFYAGAEVRPDRVDVFLRVAREILADLAARPVAADEFERAQNPVITGIERRLQTNAYWLGALGSAATRPEELASVRNYLADYRDLTPEEVRRAVAELVAEQGDWSMIVLPAR